MKPPSSVLIVVTRRIGDVLLATPLIRAIKRAWPEAAVDALVYAGSEGVLAGNPDLRKVHVIRERPGIGAHLALAGRILRRYRIALSLVASDRPTVYAWLAGRWRAGIIVDHPKHRWKRWLLDRTVPLDDLNTHTVHMHLALARALDIAPCHEVVTSWRDEDRQQLERIFPGAASQPYAVLHVYPKFTYKMWRPEAWIEAADMLRDRGLKVVFTGGGDIGERAYVGAIAKGVPDALDLCGKLTLGAAACLITGARLYAGPDTALTHVAAATGVPVVALYGPSNPVKWGPWPSGYAGESSPWRRHGSQQVGNVILLQGTGACVPCLKEGCDRNIASYSDCLQELPLRAVIAAFNRVLGPPAAAAVEVEPAIL
jgi:heptosyltransferase-3